MYMVIYFVLVKFVLVSCFGKLIRQQRFNWTKKILSRTKVVKKEYCKIQGADLGFSRGGGDGFSKKISKILSTFFF